MQSAKIFLTLAMMVMVAESTVFITGGGLALAGLLSLKAALFGGALIGAAASRRRTKTHYRPSRKSYSRRYLHRVFTLGVVKLIILDPGPAFFKASSCDSFVPQ